jgi:hypothetical protein
MTIPAVTGTLDPVANVVNPNDALTWADSTTWDQFPLWSMQPVEVMTWLCEILDLEQSRVFNLIIETLAQGEVSYRVFTSDTGEFLGEETETYIPHGSDDIPVFSGRYVWVAVEVRSQGSSVQQLQGVLVRSTDRSNTLTLNNIDTATLSGSVGARILSLPRAVGGVKNMQITVKSSPNYTLDVYVTDWPTSNTLIPRIIDRSPPTIALVGLDNVPRDGVVDVKIDYLAENYMQGNNLLVR